MSNLQNDNEERLEDLVHRIHELAASFKFITSSLPDDTNEGLAYLMEHLEAVASAVDDDADCLLARITAC